MVEGIRDSRTPSALLIFRVWMVLGLQSFGGGAATLFLIQRAVVEEHRWITADDFTRCWAVCQIAPGINLLGLTILIGWRLRGLLGVVLALTGLLLPSVALTVLITALYRRYQGLEAVQEAIHGIVPGTIGLGLLLAWRMARPLLTDSRREGRTSLGVSLALVAGSGVIISLTSLPVVAVLWSAGLISAIAAWRRHVPGSQEEEAP
jgi:chromate transporter